LVIAGCTDSASMISRKPVVKVNESTLTVKDFSDRLVFELKDFDALSAKDPAILRRVKEKIIRDFVMRSLINDFAKQNSITVSDAELENETNSIRSSYPDDLSFREVLAENNMSFSDWQKSMKEALIERKVFKKINEKSAPVTDDDMRKYYATNKDFFKRGESIDLRQIVVDDLNKAEVIKTELRKNSFEKLAKEYSVAPEARTGGKVGTFEKGTVDIFDKAFTLPVGGVSQVLESSYGFHIFKVDKKNPAGFSAFENNKKLIKNMVEAQKEQAEFVNWLDRQIRSSRVLRDRALVDAISIETRMR
jgi:peptidyl-prolyl cis-trans isomerase C